MIYSTESFLIKCKEIHNNRYEYPLLNYKSSKSYIKIICKKHGEFIQQCRQHSKGQGCPKCAQEKHRKIKFNT